MAVSDPLFALGELEAAAQLVHRTLPPTPQGMQKDIPDQGNQNVLTEVLIMKDEKTGKYKEVDKKNNPLGSIRLDLRIINGEKTVCVGDHKFGVRGLDAKRISDIFEKAKEIFRDATRFLIFEGRPIAPLNRRLQDR